MSKIVVDVDATFAALVNQANRTDAQPDDFAVFRPSYLKSYEFMSESSKLRERKRIARRAILAHSAIVHEAVKLARKAGKLAHRLRTFADHDETDIAQVLTDAGLEAEVVGLDGLEEGHTAGEWDYYFSRLRAASVLAELLSEMLHEEPVNDFDTHMALILEPVYRSTVPPDAVAAEAA